MSYFDDVIAVIMEKNPVNELVNKYEKKMAKKYLDEEEKHKQKILEQKAIKEKMKILEEESLVSTLSEMKSDPFEVLGFWGSGENENLYMLEYLKEQEREEEKQKKLVEETNRIFEEMSEKMVEEQFYPFVMIDTYGQLESEVRKNLDFMYENYI